jgi:hypothetical protein
MRMVDRARRQRHGRGSRGVAARRALRRALLPARMTSAAWKTRRCGARAGFGSVAWRECCSTPLRVAHALLAPRSNSYDPASTADGRAVVAASAVPHDVTRADEHRAATTHACMVDTSITMRMRRYNIVCVCNFCPSSSAQHAQGQPACASGMRILLRGARAGSSAAAVPRHQHIACAMPASHRAGCSGVRNAASSARAERIHQRCIRRQHQRRLRRHRRAL